MPDDPSHSPESAQISFSAVIPAYGTAAYIAETLEGVFAQQEPDFEVIVVNDGSPDTPELEAALAPYRDRITYLVQENAGPSAARNLGIEAAHGTWIALLDSDDVWRPGYLAAHRRALAALVEQTPDLVLLYSDGVIEGGPLDGRRLMAVAPSHPEVTLARLIREECTVLTSCTIVRRDAVLRAGGFEARFRRSEDVHLWLRIALQGGRMAWHPAALVRHRRRPGSLADDTPAMVRAYLDVLEDLNARLPLTAAQRELVRRQMAVRRSLMAFETGRRQFAAGKFDAASGSLGEACVWEPALTTRLRMRLLRLGVRMTPRLLHRAWSWRHGQ